MKRTPIVHFGRRNRPAESSLQSHRSRYRRAFAAARAMRFWRPRSVGKAIGTAAFAAALSLGTSAAQAQFPASFDLGSLDGTNGFALNGIYLGGGSWSVSGAGDVNGDGIDDVLIGSTFGAPNGNRSAGESYVVFGKNSAFSSSLNLSALDGTNGFAISGVDAGDRSGYSVSDAGDVNGDGFDDVIIGAIYGNGNVDRGPGQSFLVFGQNGGFSPSLDLGMLDGTNGFVLNGYNSFDFTGYSVSGAGDINGDGFDDVVVGANRADPNSAISGGKSYVVFGQDSGFSPSLELNTLNGTNGFILNGIVAFDYSGFSVSGAGDINGDGFDDLMIGAPGADVNGNALAGESYVVFGKNGGFSSSLELSMLDGTNGFVLEGIDAGDVSGASVSSAGDVNGDGIDDMLISALADANGAEGASESYVVFGKDDAFSAIFDLSTLDGTNGFQINGIGSRSEGRSVSGAGDVNGDGFDDIIIGSPYYNGGVGESYVLFGQDGGFSASLELSELDGTNGFVLGGIDEDDRSGWSVSGAGDINGDGIDDLIIGARSADPNGVSAAGESYVVFGRLSAIPEPGSAALLGAGLLGWFTRRRRR